MSPAPLAKTDRDYFTLPQGEDEMQKKGRRERAAPRKGGRPLGGLGRYLPRESQDFQNGRDFRAFAESLFI